MKDETFKGMDLWWYRGKEGWSQKRLAKHLGVGLATLERYEAREGQHLEGHPLVVKTLVSWLRKMERKHGELPKQ